MIAKLINGFLELLKNKRFSSRTLQNKIKKIAEENPKGIALNDLRKKINQEHHQSHIDLAVKRAEDNLLIIKNKETKIIYPFSKIYKS